MSAVKPSPRVPVSLQLPASPPGSPPEASSPRAATSPRWSAPSWVPLPSPRVQQIAMSPVEDRNINREAILLCALVAAVAYVHGVTASPYTARDTTVNVVASVGAYAALRGLLWAVPAGVAAVGERSTMVQRAWKERGGGVGRRPGIHPALPTHTHHSSPLLPDGALLFALAALYALVFVGGDVLSVKPFRALVELLSGGSKNAGQFGAQFGRAAVVDAKLALKLAGVALAAAAAGEAMAWVWRAARRWCRRGSQPASVPSAGDPTKQD